MTHTATHGVYFGALVASVGVLVACSDTTPRSGRLLGRVGVRAYVTGAAETDLDGKGLFTSAGATAPGASISAARARELAVAYVRRFGSQLRGPLFREHGGPIDFQSVVAAPNVYFAETPYDIDAVRGADIAKGLIKSHGAYYFIELRSSGLRVLSVAVSAHNADLADEQSGVIDFGRLAGNDFYVAGIPANADYALPPTPEDATRIASLASGRRVKEVPRLILPAKPESPYSARWMITLDGAVAVHRKSDGQSASVRQLYVGPRGDITIAEENQPPGNTVMAATTTQRRLVPRRAAFALNFATVTSFDGGRIEP